MSIDIIDPKLNFSARAVSHSSPLYLKLQPINNITSFTLSSSSTYGPVEILIPSKVLNLKESRISFDVAIDTSGGATGYAWSQANTLTMMNRITLTSQSTNQVLFDVSNLDRYASMLSPVYTSDEDLRNKSSPFVSGNGSTSVVGGSFSSAATGQQTPCEDISANNGIANPDGLNNSYPGGFTAMKKLIVGGNNAVSYYTVEFKLGSIPFSIFSQENLQYFAGEQLLISLYFSATNRFTWDGSSITNPTTGAANSNASTTINNLSLYLYTENNPQISTSIVEKTLGSGIQIPFCYPFMQRSALSGNSQSMTQQLTRGFGAKLLFTAWSPFNTNETLNTAQDHSYLTNFLTGASSLNFNTYMDSIPILTNNNVDVFKGEHWIYMKDKLKGSCIKNINQLNIDSVWIDNFCTNPICKIDVNAMDGLDLAPIHQWSFVVNGVGSVPAMNHYVAFVCQKFLNLTPNGVQIS